LESFDRVARAFDMTGGLDRLHIIRSDFTDVFYSHALHELWVRNDFGKYVEWQRRERGPCHFWELVEFHERTKATFDNHPGNTGATKWPRNARRERKSRQSIARSSIDPEQIRSR